MLFYLPLLIFILSFAGLLVATYTDLKERIVSNKLCFALLVIGLLLHLFSSLSQQSVMPFLYSFLAMTYTFIFSYILYKFGVWAGGDVKLFSAIAALNPANPHVFNLLFRQDNSFIRRAYTGFPFFPLELFVFTIFAMFPVSFLIMLKRAEKGIRNKVLSLIGLSVLLPLIAFLLGLEASSAFMIFLFVFSAILVASMPLAKIVLVKEKKITELNEGDIVAEAILLVKGEPVREKHFNIGMLINYIVMRDRKKESNAKEIVSPLNARGVTEDEIKALKKLVSQGKLEDSILIKDSVPMVPAILFAYAFLNVFGDIIWLFI